MEDKLGPKLSHLLAILQEYKRAHDAALPKEKGSAEKLLTAMSDVQDFLSGDPKPIVVEVPSSVANVILKGSTCGETD